MTRDPFIGVTEQLKASIHRRDDAIALLNAQRWRGAMYLAGYSIECQLKAKLMRMFGCSNLLHLDEELRRRGLLSDRATIFTHQLEMLLRLANGSDRLRQNATLWPLFNIVNRWIPAWRYNPNPSSHDDAEDLVDVSDGPNDSIHVVVVSRKFDGRRMKQKHDLIWSDLIGNLTPEEWGRVSLSIGVSPEEIKAS